MGSLGIGGGGGGLVGSIPLLSHLFAGSPEKGNKFKQSLSSIPEARSATATDGTPMWRSLGRKVRVPGTVIYASKFEKDKDTESVGSGKQSQSVTLISYSVDLVIAFGQTFAGPNGAGKCHNVRAIAANSKNVYLDADPEKNEDRYSSIEIYKGGEAQLPDSVLEDIKGSGKVPGFRDTIYVVIEGLELEDFGNTIPQQWEAVLEPDQHTAGSPYLVKQALLDIWSRIPDRVSGEIDVTAVGGANIVKTGDDNTIDANGQCEGLAAEGLVGPAELMTSILTAYDLGARDEAGVLKFYDRGDEPVWPVASEHLGAAEGKSDGDRPLKLRRVDQSKLPSRILIEFYSRRNGYRRDEVEYKHPTVTNENVATLSLPLVMPRKSMRRLARRLLWEMWRQVMYCDRARLPPLYRYVQVGDYIAAKQDGETYYVRVERKATGHNFMIEVEGSVVEQRDASEDYLTSIPIGYLGDPDADADDVDDDADDPDPNPEDPDEDDYSPPLLEIAVLNTPPMTDEEAKLVGFFYGHAAKDPSAVFKAATFWKASKSGGPYDQVFSGKFKHEMKIGRAITALGSSSAAGYFVDRTNTVQVQMHEGTLASVTDDEFWAGKNLILIGDEVIAYRDVTALSPVAATVTGTWSGSNQLTRSSGSWITDGFKVGQYVRVTGFSTSGNNVYRRIVALTATVMTVDGSTTTAEGPVSGIAVTANVSNAYELSYLLRGLRDTKDHAGGHAIAERVAIWDPKELEWVPVVQGKVGKTKYFKVVPKGQTLGDVSEESVTVEGETSRPFRPQHLHYTRDTVDTENVTVRWVHSTRLADADPTAENLHPLIEPIEKYLIEVYSDSGLSTLAYSTKQVYSDHDENRVRGWLFNGAAQTAAGLTPGDEFWVRIQQVGSTVKAGNWSDTLHVQSDSTYWPPTGGMAALGATSGVVA